MARKSLYRPDFHPQEAYRLAFEGRTDLEICASMGIGEKTFYEWKNRHPQFAQAVKEGKEKPNRDVEAALYKRATGYEVTETEGIPIAGEGGEQRIRVTHVKRRHVPPDTVAQIFWLINRVPEKFKDRRHIALTGGSPGDKPIKIEVEYVGSDAVPPEDAAPPDQ